MQKIVTEHLESKGLSVIGAESNYLDNIEYEYYGDPQNEQRGKVKIKKFEGMSFKVEGLN